MTINVPVGYSDFAALRRDRRHYVDKTDFLERFLSPVPADVTLFTRPRHFGKTLFMSMLAEFFDITKDSRDLFAGLKVSENEALCREWMNRYPVIFLSLKDIDGESFGEALESLAGLLQDHVIQNRYLMESPRLLPAIRTSLVRMEERQCGIGELKESLKFLTLSLEACHGRPVIVLIDEYDVPVANAWKNGYYDRMVAFMGGFLGNALKTNRSLRFGILTGCQRIILGDLITGLNHMKCYDIANDSGYEDLFGFTRGEVERLLADAGLTDRKDIIREWYDGYCFGRRTDIYCPWSIMQYLDDLHGNPAKKPEPYWVNTGSCELPGEFVECFPATEDVRGRMAALLGGFPVAATINGTMSHADVCKDVDNFWTLLYLSGYLTPAREPDPHEDDQEAGERLLVIPNREVRSVFAREITTWIRDVLPENSRQALSTALWAQDAPEFERQLAALLTGIGFHDAREMYCQGILCAVFAMQYAGTISGRESGPGRYEVLVPDRVHGRAALLELKRADSPDQLEASVQKALDQIAERHADTCLRTEGYGTILHVGVAFCQKMPRVAFRKAGTGHGEQGA